MERYDNLSDEQAEYQIHDRLSSQKFMGITLSDPVSEEKTILLFREILSQTGKGKKLCRRFERRLSEAGLMGQEGKIVDASVVMKLMTELSKSGY